MIFACNSAILFSIKVFFTTLHKVQQIQKCYMSTATCRLGWHTSTVCYTSPGMAHAIRKCNKNQYDVYCMSIADCTAISQLQLLCFLQRQPNKELLMQCHWSNWHSVTKLLQHQADFCKHICKHVWLDRTVSTPGWYTCPLHVMVP
jgi:hypothetical protein